METTIFYEIATTILMLTFGAIIGSICSSLHGIKKELKRRNNIEELKSKL